MSGQGVKSMLYIKADSHTRWQIFLFFLSFREGKHRCRLIAVLKLQESCADFSFSFILGWHSAAISVHKSMKKIVILCGFCFVFVFAGHVQRV